MAKIIPTIILHGGAGKSSQDTDRALRVREKFKILLARSYQKLVETNSLEAVTFAVEWMENDSDFNAGIGATAQRDGKIRLSASLMDGKKGRFSGVVNVENIKNPILIARFLQAETFRVLAGEGAYLFARKVGLPICVIQPKKRRVGCDTVGACAIDRHGRLASATSTGGRGQELPGRVSDSAMPVACFATSSCAISVSGIGEEIIEEGLAVRIAQRVQDGMLISKAFQKTFSEVKQHRKQMGAIGIDQKSRVCWAKTTESFAFGWKNYRQDFIF